MILETVKIKPSNPEQGEYVLINATDFDPALHELHDAKLKDDYEKTSQASEKDASETGQEVLKKRGRPFKQKG